MPHYVYILYSVSKDRYYTGYSSNLNDRLKRHNSGRSKSTKAGIPWILVYLKTCTTSSEAYQLDQSIKRRKSREYIEQLTAGYLFSPFPLR